LPQPDDAESGKSVGIAAVQAKCLLEARLGVGQIALIELVEALHPTADGRRRAGGCGSRGCARPRAAQARLDVAVVGIAVEVGLVIGPVSPVERKPEHSLSPRRGRIGRDGRRPRELLQPLYALAARRLAIGQHPCQGETRARIVRALDDLFQPAARPVEPARRTGEGLVVFERVRAGRVAAERLLVLAGCPVVLAGFGQLARLRDIGGADLAAPHRLLQARDLRAGLRMGRAQATQQLARTLYVALLGLQHSELEEAFAVGGAAPQQALERLHGELGAVAALPVAPALQQHLLGRGSGRWRFRLPRCRGRPTARSPDRYRRRRRSLGDVRPATGRRRGLGDAAPVRGAWRRLGDVDAGGGGYVPAHRRPLPCKGGAGDQRRGQQQPHTETDTLTHSGVLPTPPALRPTAAAPASKPASSGARRAATR
jgi:hypothetical protein